MRFLRAAIAACCALLFVPASANAVETWNQPDPRGDAAPRVDILRANASWTPKKLVAKVKVRRLGRTGVVRLHMGHEGEIYQAVLRKKRSSVVKRVRTFAQSDQTWMGWSCPQVSYRWNRSLDLITVRVPIDKCIGGGESNIFLGVGLRDRRAKDKVGSLRPD